MPVHSTKTKRECTGIFMLSLIYNVFLAYGSFFYAEQDPQQSF